MGCGPGVDDPAGGTQSSTGAQTATASSTGTSTLASATADSAAPDTSTGGTSTTIDSTGSTWTWSADETHTELRCEQGAGQLVIEIYPGVLDGLCPPDPGIDPHDLVLVVIDGWNGVPAGFTVGPDAPAHVAVGLDAPLVGELAIDVDGQWSPVALHVDASNGTSSLVGDADLSLCSVSPAIDPCAD